MSWSCVMVRLCSSPDGRGLLWGIWGSQVLVIRLGSSPGRHLGIAATPAPHISHYKQIQPDMIYNDTGMFQRWCLVWQKEKAHMNEKFILNYISFFILNCYTPISLNPFILKAEYVCMYVCIYIYLYMCIHTSSYTHMYVQTHGYVQTLVYIHIG